MHMSRDATNPQHRRLVAIGVALLVLLVAIVAVSIATLTGDEDSGPDGTGPAPTSSSSPSSEAGDSVCGLPEGSAEPLTGAPETTWTLTGRMAAPSSDEAGPGTDEGGVHACFARSATGALFAAANFAADIENPEADKLEILDQRVVRDEGYEQLRKETASGDSGSDGSSSLQFAAFRLDSYSPDAATVQLIVRADSGVQQGGLFALTYNVRWVEGDWRAVLPSTGQPVVSQVASLEGYIEWSGT